jgi:hypothetical protein
MDMPAKVVLCELENVEFPKPLPARVCERFKELVQNKPVDAFATTTTAGEVGRVNKQEAKLPITM